MNPRSVDLLVIGGGCAGLSLAGELAQLESSGSLIPSTLILEARPVCNTSKTWCLWRRTSEGGDRSSVQSWHAWSFSSQERRVRHVTQNYEYSCVRGEDFFRNAIQSVKNSSRINLKLGAEVLEIEDRDGHFEVQLPDGTYICRYIVDTRPPQLDALASCKLFQCFAGYEVSIPKPVDRPLTVGLMESMVTDELGFRFDYVLPLQADRLLVEVTRFSKGQLTASHMFGDLSERIKAILPDGNFKIHRQESGIIPMGLPPIRQPENPNWVRAGIGGGAARPASGYAFARIQKWAHTCAGRLANGGSPIGHARQPAVLREMDALFLTVLRRYPELGPSLFVSMAENLSPDCFARFMTDQSGIRDLLKVVRSLPAGPFLKVLFNKFKAPVSSESEPTLSLWTRW